MEKLSPRAACFEDTQDGVRDFTQGVVSGVSACFGFVAVEGALEDGFEGCPFVGGQVCLGGFSCNGLHSRGDTRCSAIARQSLSVSYRFCFEF